MGDKQGMSFTPRSGDTHVIGEDGGAVNVDADARVEAAKIAVTAAQAELVSAKLAKQMAAPTEKAAATDAAKK